MEMNSITKYIETRENDPEVIPDHGFEYHRLHDWARALDILLSHGLDRAKVQGGYETADDSSAVS